MTPGANSERLDKKSTSISLLIALGVRQDGQKVLLAVKNMGAKARPPDGRCSMISLKVA